MAKTFASLMQEADSIIESRSADQFAKTAAANEVQDDEIFKLARELTGTPQGESSVTTLSEKIAHAVAIVDTLLNLDELVKMEQFAKTAAAAGHSPEEIGSFLEKRAKVEMKSVLKAVPWLAGVGAAGYGAHKLHQHGKEKGYNQALQDVAALQQAGQ